MVVNKELKILYCGDIDKLVFSSRYDYGTDIVDSNGKIRSSIDTIHSSMDHQRILAYKLERVITTRYLEKSYKQYKNKKEENERKEYRKNNKGLCNNLLPARRPAESSSPLMQVRFSNQNVDRRAIIRSSVPRKV